MFTLSIFLFDFDQRINHMYFNSMSVECHCFTFMNSIPDKYFVNLNEFAIIFYLCVIVQAYKIPNNKLAVH